MCYSVTNCTAMTFLTTRKSTIGPLFKDGSDTHSTAGARGNMWHAWGEVSKGFRWGYQAERDQLQHLDLGGMMTVSWVLQKQDGRCGVK